MANKAQIMYAVSAMIISLRRLAAHLGRRVRRNYALLPFLIVLGIMVVGAFVVYLLERQNQASFGSVWDGLWWAVVTMSTTGYGDLVPKTPIGRIVGVVVIMAGFSLIPTITATVATLLVTRRLKEERGMEKISYKNHIVICGWNHETPDVLRGLIAHKVGPPPRLVMLNESPEAAMGPILSEHQEAGLKWVRGDFASESALHLANVQAAAAAIVLADTPKA